MILVKNARLDGYFVSTIGINEAMIQRSIEYHGREDMEIVWLNQKGYRRH